MKNVPLAYAISSSWCAYQKRKISRYRVTESNKYVIAVAALNSAQEYINGTQIGSGRYAIRKEHCIILAANKYKEIATY